MTKRVPFLAAVAVLLALAVHTPASAREYNIAVFNRTQHPITVRVHPAVCIQAVGAPVEIGAGAFGTAKVDTSTTGRCADQAMAKFEMRIYGGGDASATVLWEKPGLKNWRPFIVQRSGMKIVPLRAYGKSSLEVYP